MNVSVLKHSNERSEKKNTTQRPRKNMKLDWNFKSCGGGVVQIKNPSWGRYGYFLEQHNYLKIERNCNIITV